MVFSIETVTAVGTHLEWWIQFQERLGNNEVADAAREFLASLGALSIVASESETIPRAVQEAGVLTFSTAEHPTLSAA